MPLGWDGTVRSEGCTPGAVLRVGGLGCDNDLGCTEVNKERAFLRKLGLRAELYLAVRPSGGSPNLPALRRVRATRLVQLGAR